MVIVCWSCPSKGSVTIHGNSCLHFLLNFVNKAGVKCQTFTSAASNILGNVCNLESPSCAAVQRWCPLNVHMHLFWNSDLAFIRKDHAFLSQFEGDIEQNVTSLKFFLLQKGESVLTGASVWSEEQFPWACLLCSCVSCRTCFIAPLQHFSQVAQKW